MAKEMRHIIYGWQASQLEEEMRKASNLHRRLEKSERRISEMQSGARLEREMKNADHLRGKIRDLTMDPNAEKRLDKLRDLSQA